MIELNDIASLAGKKDVQSLKKSYKYAKKWMCLKLLRIVQKDIEYTDKTGIRLLFRSKNSSGYYHAKKKLKNDLMYKIEMNHSSAPISKVLQLCNLAYVFQSKNNTAKCLNYLVDAYKIAEKHRLLSEKRYIKSKIRNVEADLLKKARLQFTEDSFDKSHQILYENDFFKDNPVLHLGARYLGILINIELNDWSLADCNLKASKVYFIRNHKYSYTSRTISIYKILNSIIRHEDVEIALTNYKNEIDGIDGMADNNICYWEVIRFEEWLKNKPCCATPLMAQE